MLVASYTILHLRVTRLAPCVPPCTIYQRAVVALCDTCNRSFLSDKCLKIIWPWEWNDTLKWSRAFQSCYFLVTSDSKHECFNRFLISARRSIHQEILVTWFHSSLASFQTGLNIFLWYGVYSRSWQAWQNFRTRTELYICSENVSRVWSQWKLNIDFYCVAKVSTCSSKSP
jgi:hypothetical protein